MITRRGLIKGFLAASAMAAVPIVYAKTKIKQLRTVFVNDMSDFPAPIDGIVRLEADTTYIIGKSVELDRTIILNHGTCIQGLVLPMNRRV